MAGDGTPIIIKKKKAHGHAHHGGSWKVAYADFVTAMMAFFMVMWILGLSDESKTQISGYFNDPFGYSKSTPFVRNIVRFPGVLVTTGGTIKKQKADIKRDNELAVLKIQDDIQKKIEELLRKGAAEALVAGKGKGAAEKGAAGKGSSDGGGASKGAASGAAAESKGHEASGKGILPEVGSMKELLKHVDVVVTDEGLRIEFLEDTGRNVFFDSGSFNMKPEALRIVRALTPILKATGRPMKIEGHTDARPYGAGATFNNWDLSANRASALRRALEKNGIDEGLFVGVTGYADTELKNRTDPLDGKNRRVSILLPTKDDKEVEEVYIADIRPAHPTIAPPITPGINITKNKPVAKPGQKDGSKPSFWERKLRQAPKGDAHSH